MMEGLCTYRNALQSLLRQAKPSTCIHGKFGSAKYQRRMVFVSPAFGPLVKPGVFQESKAGYVGSCSRFSARGVQTAASTSTTGSPQSTITLDVKIEGQSHDLQIQEYYLPELRCYFPPKCHSDYEGIRDEIFHWTLDWKHLGTEQEREFLLQSDFPGIWCWIVPMSPHRYRYRLLLACKLAVWIVHLDDQFHETNHVRDDSNAIDKVIQQVQGILEGFDSNIDLHIPEVKAISPVLRQLRADMSPSMHKRHVQTLSPGLSRFETKVDRRVKNELSDLATYISTRRNTFGFNHMQVMIEYCLGVELDEEILQMECMQELHKATVDFLSWTNDLISFRKEYFEGDLQNLLQIIHFESGGKLDFQHTVNKACQMIQARERDFVQILHEISLSDVAARSPDLRVYLRNLPNVLTGHLQWLFTSARYHGVGHSMENLKHGMLQMLPEKTVIVPLADNFIPTSP